MAHARRLGSAAGKWGGLGGVLSAGLLTAPAMGQPFYYCWGPGPGHQPPGVPESWGPQNAVLFDFGEGPVPTIGVRQVRRWSPSQSAWVPAGPAFDGDVHKLKVLDGQLIAVGAFTSAGPFMYRAARWDPFAQGWMAIGYNISGGALDDIAWHNGQYYAVGEVQLQGSPTTQRLIWSAGLSWFPGPAAEYPLGSIASVNGQLYAGVHRDQVQIGRRIYRLNGSAWTQVALLDTAPWVLGTYSNQLVAGGIFQELNGSGGFRRVASFDGSNWFSLGGGIQGTTGRIASLETHQAQLLVAGRFNFAGTQSTASNMGLWNGSTWSAVGGSIYTDGMPGAASVSRAFSDGAGIIATGDFLHADGMEVNRIARWDGERWRAYVPGINASVRALLRSGPSTSETMYAGGEFNFPWEQLGNLPRLCRAQGSTLEALTAIGGQRGTNGPVHALAFHTFSAVQGPRLIMGGTFSAAGGVIVSNVASYALGNTSGYAALGAGLNGTVYALASYGGSLYAAGNFTASGSTPVAGFARYSGGAWQPVGTVGLPAATVLHVHDGVLYIGSRPGGHGISAWDGANLSTVAITDNVVLAMTTYKGELIAAGAFTNVNATTAMRVAKRSAGGEWSAVGFGLAGGVVHALHVKESLYAGGSFASSGGSPIRRLARWNGSAWEEAAGGVDGTVYALSHSDCCLHVGGNFGSGFKQQSNPYQSVWSPYWLRLGCLPPAPPDPPACYPNCDGSTTPPILNVADFGCFLTRYAAGDPYANCDGSTLEPVLNVADFGCFLTKYAAGCP